MLVVNSRNLAALWFNQFEINKIWQSAQSKKAQTLEKKTPLVVSLEGTLIPSILLPAHFMPCSALIDVKIGFQIREYQCVCLCVCPFAPHTCSFACVCVLLLCAFYYFILTPYRSSSVEPADLSCIWAPVQPEHITLMKGTEAFFNVRRTFKLHELVIVLWLSFRRLIENWAEHMVWLCERWTNRHGWGGVGRDVWAPFFFVVVEFRVARHLTPSDQRDKN